ncbi:hypothetical protein FS837_004510 [Tulasnella sp. UAMH 9824]|nr:hypothetical protein FS837_004510 [Tulasnella sp. UAMH 9824]
MNVATQNLPNAPVFEVPDPVEEFGQDGGKFYRCYDALADEIDEDMVKGLKEQLDGMLIFAGLFAGVNSAFLALTLPLLSADPSDDISALLAHNNAILIQMATGRNDSIPANSRLPSAEFSPSRDIFAVNALFSLSLSFAIISSFLAVLGRQWLVYYRKRSGGGPDRQRWEQLKRFLGAERWQLEPILDDVLPSLLQLGLIIFCASLILYLRHLSPAISLIVGVPMYVALAFFVGSGLCTVWDRFCPFQSPLSHILLWSARTLPSAMKIIKELEWKRLGQRLSIERWVHVLIRGREAESTESLQAIALQRAICISDDPATLLHATANIFGITKVSQMEQLWSDQGFQERFLDLLQNSYSRMLQLRGHNQVNVAASSQRLFSAAAAHIIMYRDTEGDIYENFEESIRLLREESILIPHSQLLDSSAALVRATVSFTILQFRCYGLGPSLHTFDCFFNHLTTFVAGRERCDSKLACIISLIVIFHDDLYLGDFNFISPLRDAYRRGRTDGLVDYFVGAFAVISAPSRRISRYCNPLAIYMLSYVDQMISDESTQEELTAERRFFLLEGCELILRVPQLQRVAHQVIQKLRFSASKTWQRECADAAAQA